MIKFATIGKWSLPKIPKWRQVHNSFALADQAFLHLFKAPQKQGELNFFRISSLDELAITRASDTRMTSRHVFPM